MNAMHTISIRDNGDADPLSRVSLLHLPTGGCHGSGCDEGVVPGRMQNDDPSTAVIGRWVAVLLALTGAGKACEPCT